MQRVVELQDVSAIFVLPVIILVSVFLVILFELLDWPWNDD